MKIIFFTGGLGNQIFEYSFYRYLKSKFPNQNFYGLYNKKVLNEHYGFELYRWFEVDPIKSTLLSNLVAYSIYILRHIFNVQSLYDSNRKEFEKPKAIMYYGLKPNKNYIPTNPNWLKFKIDYNVLAEENKKLLINIRESNSVFIHVRRGDYISKTNFATFGNICTDNYYNRAIEIIEAKILNPKYFVFSDDIEWCKKQLSFNNATYIDWNIADNSPIDMFLMANCKYSIIANSTFSYWGSRLITNKSLVIYPKKWINNNEIPDIFPDEWIGI